MPSTHTHTHTCRQLLCKNTVTVPSVLCQQGVPVPVFTPKHSAWLRHTQHPRPCCLQRETHKADRSHWQTPAATPSDSIFIILRHKLRTHKIFLHIWDVCVCSCLVVFVRKTPIQFQFQRIQSPRFVLCSVIVPYHILWVHKLDWLPLNHTDVTPFKRLKPWSILYQTSIEEQKQRHTLAFFSPSPLFRPAWSDRKQEVGSILMSIHHRLVPIVRTDDITRSFTDTICCAGMKCCRHCDAGS